MPNWCENTALIRAEKSIIDGIVNIIESEKGILSYIVPEPDYNVTPVAKTFTKDGEENIPSIREDSWYDWRLQNWGCKWDLSEVSHTREDDNTLWIGFWSPWSPPIEAFKTLSEKCEIELWFYEPGCDFTGKLHGNKETIFEISKLSMEDFEENDLLEELDNEFNLEEEILRYNPAQLRPHLEKIINGLTYTGEYDIEVLEHIYQNLKNEDVKEGSIKMQEDSKSLKITYTFNNKTYAIE